MSTELGGGTKLDNGSGPPSGATKGLFAIQSPRYSASTSTGYAGDFDGNQGNWSTVEPRINPWIVPFSGRIKKVSLSKFVGGSFGVGNHISIKKYVDGQGPAVELGDLIILNVLDVQEFIVDYPFDAKDGFGWRTDGIQAGAKFSVNLEIEYDLV